MSIEKTFAFTKTLEKNLENLFKIESLSIDKKNQIEKNLNLISNFNKMEFLDPGQGFKPEALKNTSVKNAFLRN